MTRKPLEETPGEPSELVRKLIEALAQEGPLTLGEARERPAEKEDAGKAPHLKLVIPSEWVKKLNVRGGRRRKRDDYPAVEYDFVPHYLNVDPGWCLHIQFHGSDFNNPKNSREGEGWDFSDRSNVVEDGTSDKNFPVFETPDVEKWTIPDYWKDLNPPDEDEPKS